MTRKHRCFEMDVDGLPVRVHGDPSMSPESMTALTELVRVAKERLGNMTPEEWERFRVRSQMEVIK